MTWPALVPAAHRWVSCGVAAALLFRAVRPGRGAQPPDWRWVGGIFLLLTIGRWPALGFPFALNPDESQFLAGAHTLRADPVFWRSVNGMTSGPLNYYALCPLGSLLGADSYLSARLTGLLLTGCALGFVHGAAARRFGIAAARLAGLPTLLFLALTAHPDFIGYSSELLSMALIALAIHLTVRWVWDAAAPGPVGQVLIGLALGAVPLAKPQAAPIALVIGLALLAWLLRGPGRSYRAILRLVGGAALPVLGAGLLILAHGLGRYVLIAYLRDNQDYVGTRTLGLVLTARKMLTEIEPTSPIFYAWIAASAVTGVLGLAWLKRPAGGHRAFLFAAGGITGVAFLCVIIPGRLYPHYLQLMPVPGILLVSALVGSDFRLLVAGLSLILIGVRALVPYPPRASLTPYHTDYAQRVTAAVRRYSRPGDTLAVWGWRPEYYVLSGLGQGARDAVTESSIIPGRYRDYFQACFLSDLRRSRPAIFIDGVGPGGFAYADRATEGHDAVFPALAALIARDYALKADLDGSRVYVRKDQPIRNQPHPLPDHSAHPP